MKLTLSVPTNDVRCDRSQLNLIFTQLLYSTFYHFGFSFSQIIAIFLNTNKLQICFCSIIIKTFWNLSISAVSRHASLVSDGGCGVTLICRSFYINLKLQHFNWGWDNFKRLQLLPLKPLESSFIFKNLQWRTDFQGCSKSKTAERLTQASCLKCQRWVTVSYHRGSARNINLALGQCNFSFRSSSFKMAALISTWGKTRKFQRLFLRKITSFEFYVYMLDIRTLYMGILHISAQSFMTLFELFLNFWTLYSRHALLFFCTSRPTRERDQY